MGAAKREEADRIIERLTKEKEESDRRREEMEDLLMDRLYFEENEEKFRLAKEFKAKQQAAASAEMIAANDCRRLIRAAMRLEEEAEEEQFRKVMFERFAEQDRLEQMHAQKRRMKMQEHKREVERLAAALAAMYEEQMQREVEENIGREREEANAAAIVEQERQRLLVEHAARLKEFLPKGVSFWPEDLDLINTVRASSIIVGSTRAGSRAAGSRAFEM